MINKNVLCGKLCPIVEPLALQIGFRFSAISFEWKRKWLLEEYKRNVEKYATFTNANSHLIKIHKQKPIKKCMI